MLCPVAFFFVSKWPHSAAFATKMHHFDAVAPKKTSPTAQDDKIRIFPYANKKKDVIICSNHSNTMFFHIMLDV